MGGALASGMAVKMEITFYPDTLRDYTDHLTVESEGFTVKIPVEARRDPPQLTLPPTIDIGENFLFTISILAILKYKFVVAKVAYLILSMSLYFDCDRKYCYKFNKLYSPIVYVVHNLTASKTIVLNLLRILYFVELLIRYLSCRRCCAAHHHML